MKYEYKIKTKDELLHCLDEWRKDTYCIGIDKEKIEAINIVIEMVKMLSSDEMEMFIKDTHTKREEFIKKYITKETNK